MKSRSLYLSLAFTAFFSGCLKIPEYRPETVDVTYEFKGGTDMTSLFNLTATYTGADNISKSEQIHSLPWSRSVRTNMPFGAELIVGFEKKTVTPERERYSVGFDGTITYVTSDGQSSKKRMCLRNEKPQEGSVALRFRVVLPAGVSGENIQMAIPPLKYDKHFAFTFTVDDSYENAWSRIFPLIHGKWIDDTEFFHLGCTPTSGYVPAHTLAMTDGCGNERRFGFGIAIWPTLRDDWHPDGRIRDNSTSVTNPYITWDELRTILDFGGSVYFHNVDETRYDLSVPASIVSGFEDDYAKTVAKLGRKMKVLALPDGRSEYAEAARLSPRIAFIRSSLNDERIYLNSCGSLYKKATYGGEISSDIPVKLTELAAQAASDNPYWTALTVHRPQDDYMEMLTTVNNLYGRDGSDNIWVASWDEIYEYVEMREKAIIAKKTDQRNVTFEVSLPDNGDFSFSELSFVMRGAAKGCTVTPLSDNIYGLYYAPQKNNSLLINVNFDPWTVRLAEKYTTRYEMSASDADKADAEYFVSRLLPDLAAPFLSRIAYTSLHPVVISEIKINGGVAVCHERNVEISLIASGNPGYYRVGETADLSGKSWNEFENGTFEYELSEGFGKKTLYVQVKNGTDESPVFGAAINYTETFEPETIGRERIESYIEKYAGYKASYRKNIEPVRREK